MRKYLTFNDKRVLDKLAEMESIGVKPSKYISDLILNDCDDNKKVTKDDLVKMIMAFVTLDGTNLSSIENANLKQIMNKKSSLSNAESIEDIKSILNID